MAQAAGELWFVVVGLIYKLSFLNISIAKQTLGD
jgi:hypothetical protein